MPTIGGLKARIIVVCLAFSGSWLPVEENIVQDPTKLRILGAWYRDFAERAGNPVIWEARLRTADDLDQEADRIEHLLADLTPSKCCPSKAQRANGIQGQGAKQRHPRRPL